MSEPDAFSILLAYYQQADPIPTRSQSDEDPRFNEPALEDYGDWQTREDE